MPRWPGSPWPPPPRPRRRPRPSCPPRTGSQTAATSSAAERAQIEGFQDGRFYANGWHITGEMGGIWTPPLKLLDGVWFGIDDKWLGPATKFTSGWGYTRFTLPDTAGLKVERTDFAPDGRRAALFGLKLTNPGAARTVDRQGRRPLRADAELPVGLRRRAERGRLSLADTGAFDGGALVFRDAGHAAAPERRRRTTTPRSSARTRGRAAARPAPGHCGPAGPADAVHRPTTPVPCVRRRPVRQGHRRPAALLGRPARRTARGRSGSPSPAPTRAPAPRASELQRALDDPDGALAAKIAAREQLGALHAALAARRPAARPGHRVGQAEHRRPHAARRGPADPRRRPGQAVPAAAGHGRAGALGRRRLPGLPVDLRHRRRVHGVRERHDRASSRRSRTTCARCATSPRSLNGDSGKVTHEIIADGSAVLRQNKDAGNTDETGKFPSTGRADLALDRRRRASATRCIDFAKRNLRYVDRQLDEDGDGWPEGLGNVERPGHGRRRSSTTPSTRSAASTTSPTWRSPRATPPPSVGAREGRRPARAASRATWWYARRGQHADSLKEPGNVRIHQKHWIGVDADGGRADHRRPAVARPGAARARDDRAGRARGPVLLRASGRTTAACSTPAAAAARRAPASARSSGSTPRSRPSARATTAGSAPTSRSATRTPRSSRCSASLRRRRGAPHAGHAGRAARRVPEIFPSPDFDAAGLRDANVERCTRCRSMVMQAWNQYGTMWPVVHQQLGVRPDLGRGALEVVPQLPSVVADRRLAHPARRRRAEARAGVARAATRYTTTVDTGSRAGRRARRSATRCRGSAKVANGHARRQEGRAGSERTTNRGLEVTTKARRPGDAHAGGDGAASGSRPSAARSERAGGAARVRSRRQSHDWGVATARSERSRTDVQRPSQRLRSAHARPRSTPGRGWRAARRDRAVDLDRVELRRAAELLQRGEHAGPHALGLVRRPGGAQAAPADPGVERPDRAAVVAAPARTRASRSTACAGRSARQHVGLAQPRRRPPRAPGRRARPPTAASRAATRRPRRSCRRARPPSRRARARRGARAAPPRAAPSAPRPTAAPARAGPRARPPGCRRRPAATPARCRRARRMPPWSWAETGSIASRQPCWESAPQVPAAQRTKPPPRSSAPASHSPAARHAPASSPASARSPVAASSTRNHDVASEVP